MKLKVMLANANSNLSAIAPRVEAAALRAENFAREKLIMNYGINLVISELDFFLIPEDGVGGRTYRADFILVTLDLKKNPSEDILYEVFAMNCAMRLDGVLIPSTQLHCSMDS